MLWAQSLICVWLSLTPFWTVAHQAPLSMEFSRQEYWSRLTFSPPGNLPDPGIKPSSLMPPALAGRFFITEPPGKPSWGNNTANMLSCSFDLCKWSLCSQKSSAEPKWSNNSRCFTITLYPGTCKHIPKLSTQQHMPKLPAINNKVTF